MKIERTIQEFNSGNRNPLVPYKFSFHERGYITLYARLIYTHGYVRLVRGRVPLCLRRFAPWWNATENFYEHRKKGGATPSPFLVLLPLQGPLTFFRSFPFHRLLFIRISSFEARSGLFGGYRRKGEKKEIRVHGRVIKNEGNEGFPWQLFLLFSEYDSPPRPDCGVGLEREIERENHFIS